MSLIDIPQMVRIRSGRLAARRERTPPYLTRRARNWKRRSGSRRAGCLLWTSSIPPDSARPRAMQLPRLEHKYVVFLVCVTGIFITVFDTTSSIVALPTIAHEFGTDLPTAQ